MELNEIRSQVSSMADKIYNMLGLIEKGFMENKQEPLTDAMKEENDLNTMEKELTKAIFELSKKSKDRDELGRLHQMAEIFERMGDEAASLVERIEIKVAERLLFSDIGVEQFNETYKAMMRSVEMMREFLKEKKKALIQKIIENGFYVKALIERYRKEHSARLVEGLCTPLGANMYFDMLDFTGNLARHSSNIVKLFE